MKEADITEKTSTSQPRWLTIVRIALGLYPVLERNQFYQGLIQSAVNAAENVHRGN